MPIHINSNTLLEAVKTQKKHNKAVIQEFSTDPDIPQETWRDALKIACQLNNHKTVKLLLGIFLNKKLCVLKTEEIYSLEQRMPDILVHAAQAENSKILDAVLENLKQKIIPPRSGNDKFKSDPNMLLQEKTYDTAVGRLRELQEFSKKIHTENLEEIAIAVETTPKTSFFYNKTFALACRTSTAEIVAKFIDGFKQAGTPLYNAGLSRLGNSFGVPDPNSPLELAQQNPNPGVLELLQAEMPTPQTTSSCCLIL